MDQSRNEKIEKYLASQRDNIVEDLFALARIPSVQGEAIPGRPYGEEVARALDAALAQCEREGMQTENLGYRCGSALWRAEGAGEKELAIVAHLDVVPAGDGWSGKPFEPFLRDGYAIARGVRDNKNAAIAGLYAVRCIKELGFPMKHGLRVIFGCAEETGMDDLPYYAKAHEGKMPVFSIVPDTAFPVCHGEKGIYSCQAVCGTPWSRVKDLSGGVASNVVPDFAQAVLPMDTALLAEVKAAAGKTTGITVTEGSEGITVSAAGRTAHAARPQAGDNAIRKLLRFLSAIEGLGESDRAACAFAADSIEDCYGEHLGIAFTDEPSGRLTCISGLAHTEEGRLVMGYNIRYSVTHKGELVTAGLEKAFTAAGWSLRKVSDSVPMYLPADDPKVKELCRIYHEVTGKDATPYVIGGGTYARHLRNAVGFGMETDTPTGLPEGHGKAHEPDEAVIIDELLDAIKIYILSILEVDELLHR